MINLFRSLTSPVFTTMTAINFVVLIYLLQWSSEAQDTLYAAARVVMTLFVYFFIALLETTIKRTIQEKDDNDDV